MPSLESRLARMLLRLCVGVAATVLLAGCHYTEQEKWSVCCVLYVRADETAGFATRVIVDWYRNSDFDGDGQGGLGPYGDGKTYYSNKDEKIRADVLHFIADHPERRAADYFVDLGMTCGSSATTSRPGVTHCQVSLPVQVRCGPTYRFLPGTTPIPDQLQKPFAGVLHVSVGLSTNAPLKTLAQVYPVPGGRLCHQ